MKQVRICLGRFQPFTLGHLKMATYKDLKGPDSEQKESLREQPDLKEIKNQKTIILMISTPKEKVDSRHPFSDDVTKKEMDFIKKNYSSDIEDVIYVKSADICAWGEMLKQKGYQASVWLTGSDEVSHYKPMALNVAKYEESNRDNRDFKDACSKSFYIESIERTDSGDFVSSISGTKVREALKNDDREYFKKAMPKDCDKLFDEYKEELLNAPEPPVKKTKKKIKESKFFRYLSDRIKPLNNFIRESFIYEGGHSVDGASPIKGNLAGEVANQIMKALKEKFGDIPMSPLGSTGKKRADQTSGDIDIAIEYPWVKYKEVKSFIENKFKPVPGKDVESLHVFNIGFKYDDEGEEKVVQVDFMFVENVDFAKFCFHSPSFINNESKFKGAWRTQTLIGCVDCLDAEKVLGKEYAPEYFTEEDYDGSYKGQVKTMWRVLFNKVDGMKVKKVSYAGNKKPVKSPKTVEARSYTKNIDEMIKLCFGPKANRETFNSYETILDFISSDKFIWRSKELLEKIKNWVFTNTGLLEESSEETISQAKELFNNAIKSI